MLDIEIQNTIAERLKSVGWVEVEGITSDSDLVNLAQSIGTIVPHPNGQTIFRLIPKKIGEGIPGTFSNRYGYDSFPLHTDTAFWPNPAHYVLLSSSLNSESNTIVASSISLFKQLSTNDLQLAKRAIFKVKTHNSQFYTSLLFRKENIIGVKFDSSCMLPANKFAKRFVELLAEIDMDIFEIKWSGNKAVIIDNWKCMHGRSVVQVNERRELKRIYIN